MKNLLLVFSNPLNGRDDDLNHWYTHVHIRDVMRMPASIGVQRFVFADDQPTRCTVSSYRYLAMYETDDTARCTAAHAAAMTPKLPISDAFDLTSPCNYFRARSFITADPLAAGDGDIVVAEFADLSSFDLPAAARLVGHHGVISVAHLGVMGDQLIPRDPTQPELALLRLTGDGVKLGALDISSVVRNAAIVSHYRPLIRRLTTASVLNASAKEQAIEDRARSELGEKVHRLPV